MVGQWLRWNQTTSVSHSIGQPARQPARQTVLTIHQCSLSDCQHACLEQLIARGISALQSLALFPPGDAGRGARLRLDRAAGL
eukprot:scaffold561756_cov20-Prasinocladus_malaysianus.AAC.1